MTDQQPIATQPISFKLYLSSKYPDKTKEIDSIFHTYESQLKLYQEQERGKNLKYKYFEDQNRNLMNIANNSTSHQQSQLNHSNQGNIEQKLPQSGIYFPYFNQLQDQIKQLLGPQQFLELIKSYVKAPEHTQKVKEELNRLEREVLNIEAKEEEKMLLSGLPVLRETLTYRHFEYSSLGDDIQEEFKNAKWVVLTTPIVSKQSGKVGIGQAKDSSSSNIIQISNGSGGPSMNQTGLSLSKTTSALGNLNQSSYQTGKIINPPPQKRYGHSATLVKNKMFIFGGLASQMKGGNFQTFYECQLKFNSDDGTLFNWEKIKLDAPKARDSHSCIHVGDSLILFGGSGGTTSFNDLNRYDLKTQKWTRLEPIGDIPAPREGHTAKAIGKDRMMVHGGVNQSEISFNDTYILTGLSQLSESQQQAVISNIESKSVSPIQFNLEAPINAGSADTNTSNAVGSVQKQNGTQSSNKQGLNILKWYKCIQQGDIPLGRDSHSSAQINNKIYIFGGQGDNDMIFDDFYSVEIIEQIAQNGELTFIAKWVRLEQQTPQEQFPPIHKPIARTSHTCTVYKNRYLIIIGGETIPNSQEQKNQNEFVQQSKQKQKEDICIDLEQECNSSEQDVDGSQKNGQDYIPPPLEKLNFLNDVWVYDTILQKWHEIKPHFKIQGPLAGKKIKKVFEPRMAHSAIQYDQFVVIFGGLNQERQPISNDLFVLSLDGELGIIKKSLESGQESKQQIQIPEVNVMEKVPNGQGQKDKVKITKTLKISEPDDRREMSGQILNQIINFNSNQTNQFFINGSQLFANAAPTQNFGFSHSNQFQKQDCQIQTYDNTQNIPTQKQLERQQVTLIMKSNDFALRVFQKTKVSFFKSIIRSIEWPLQCFAGFIDNSIQAFELQKYKQEQPRQMHHGSAQSMMNNYVNQNQKMNNITIEINMKNSSTKIGDKDNSNNNTQYLEIKDNGPGIHPKQLMEVLTSFGSTNLLNIKSDYNFSEHGINLKLCALRLANNALIITKTKPYIEYGSSSQYLSIALLSMKFIEDASSQFLVSPLVSFELKNKKIIKNLTPQSDHFLNKISQYTQPIFNDGQQIQQYAMNIMGECGTHIILMDLCSQTLSKQETYCEIYSVNNDITLNPKCFTIESQKENLLETSLRTYLKFLYVEQPENVKIVLNGKQVDMQNPYSALKMKFPTVFKGDRQEKFAAQILDEKVLKEQYDKIKQEQLEDENKDDATNQQINTYNMSDQENSWLREVSQLQGVLIYRGTGRLIRRIECVFGDDEYDTLSNSMKYVTIDGMQSSMFKKNGIISVFKSKSSTQIDKKDFQDKQIIKKIREWMREKDMQQLSVKVLQQPADLDYAIIKPDQAQIVQEQENQEVTGNHSHNE